MALVVESVSSKVQITELSRYFSSLPGCSESLFTQCSSPDTPDAVALSSLLSSLPSLFSHAADQQIEGCVNVLCSLVRKVGAATGKSSELFADLRGQISASTEKALLRLKILGNVFNAEGARSAERMATFRAVAEMAERSGHAEVVTPQLGRLDRWLEEWGASVQQRREMYQVGCTLLARAGASEAEKEQLLTLLPKLLATYEVKDGEEAKSEEAVIKAVALAVGLPEVYRMDHLLGFRVVRDMKDGVALQLLRVFVEGDLAQYRKFLEQEGGRALLEKLGLDDAQCTRKMRLLTLVSLCAKAQDGVLAYEKVATELGIEEAEVEAWVVEAVRKRLVSAKLDQEHRVIRFTGAQQRLFDLAQWQALESRLSTWKQSVAALSASLTQQAEAAASQ